MAPVPHRGATGPLGKTMRTSYKGTLKPKGKGKGKGKGKPKPKAPNRLDTTAYLSPRTERQILADAEAAAALRYGPQQQALNQQATNISGTATQPGWFDTYRAGLAQQQTAMGNRYDQAQAAVDARAAVGPVQAAPGAQGTGQAAIDLNTALAAHKAIQGAFSDYLTAQKTAEGDYFGGRATVSDAAKLSAQTGTSQQLAQLAGEKGLFKTDYLSGERTKERNYSNELAVLGLNTQKAETGAALDLAGLQQKKTEAKQKKKEAGRKVNQYGYTERDWRGLSTGARQRIIKDFKASGRAPAKTKPRFSPKDQASNRVTLRKAIAVVKRNDNGTQGYRKDIMQALVDKGVDPLIARVAAGVGTGNTVSSAVARALYRDYGIRVKVKPVKRPKPTLVPDVTKAPGPGGELRPN